MARNSRKAEKEETIAAIATPPGTGAIGIIRVSGPGARAVLQEVFVPVGKGPVRPRRMELGWIRGPEGPLDRAQACFYPGPASYTGEDMLELFPHGGPVLMAAVLELVLKAGARAALPGEFTRRAVAAGKLDLAQAEAVSWLIEAGSREELEAAARQLEGGLGERLTALRSRVLAFLAEVEAALDFEELEDALPCPALVRELEGFEKEISLILAEAAGGEKLRRGPRVVLAGSPNTGKSSLLNRLLGKNRAIVSDLPGTTRDTVEEDLILGGTRIRLVDTAGIRSSSSGVEAEGVRRAREEVAAADLVLLVLDGSGSFGPDDREVCRLARGGRVLLILNKEDLGGGLELEEARKCFPGAGMLSLSALSGSGIEFLRRRIAEEAPSPAGALLAVSRRRRELLETAAAAAGRARELTAVGGGGELIAYELRETARALDLLLSRDASGEVLEEIFSRFCLGK